MVGFSTKSRYGLRAMIYLAKNCKKEEVCPLREIADEENISPDYLEKIISKLRKKDLVKSKKGVGGGYCLKKSPDQIKVKEILEALEENLTPIDCITGEEECSREEECEAKVLWERVNRSLNSTLNSITLSDLINN